MEKLSGAGRVVPRLCGVSLVRVQCDTRTESDEWVSQPRVTAFLARMDGVASFFFRHWTRLSRQG